MGTHGVQATSSAAGAGSDASEDHSPLPAGILGNGSPNITEQTPVCGADMVSEGSGVSDVCDTDADAVCVVDSEPAICSNCSRMESLAAGLCLPCRFRVMDPFRPVLKAEDVLHIVPTLQASLAFSLDLPRLRQWRKEGHDVEVRGLRKCKNTNDRHHPIHQAWPRYLDLEVNSHKVVTVKPPLRGHKRRDVPQSISANLRRDENKVKLETK